MNLAPDAYANASNSRAVSILDLYNNRLDTLAQPWGISQLQSSYTNLEDSSNLLSLIKKIRLVQLFDRVASGPTLTGKLDSIYASSGRQQTNVQGTVSYPNQFIHRENYEISQLIMFIEFLQNWPDPKEVSHSILTSEKEKEKLQHLLRIISSMSSPGTLDTPRFLYTPTHIGSARPILDELVRRLSSLPQIEPCSRENNNSKHQTTGAESVSSLITVSGRATALMPLFSPCKDETVKAGRPPVIVYQVADNESVSVYQCFLRQQLEFFEATESDISCTIRGRNTPIVLGQVGIRCRHCSYLSPKYRSRGSMYYPKKMHLIYQAAQGIANTHLTVECQSISNDVKSKIRKLYKKKSLLGGGKNYWGMSASAIGVYEASDCLRFA
jgi:hypothetical protein